MILMMVIIAILMNCSGAEASKLLVFMDRIQSDHLRAYGLAFWTLSCGHEIKWVLNYRGGAFILPDLSPVREKAAIMGVSFQPLDSAQESSIYTAVEDENMEVVVLEKAPRVAIYSPPENDPWDDAVTMALEYSQIPYDKVWDKEVLKGKLSEYDWLHLHHEDFTGQHGKFYGSFKDVAWYRKRVMDYQRVATELGYSSVSEEKKAVAREISSFVTSGGFLFAMCSATDSLDIALSAEGVDIVSPELDGTPVDPDAQGKLNFARTMSFQNFHLITNPMIYEFSDIDVDPRQYSEEGFRGDFSLFEFSAKFDRACTILTQCHVRRVKGFLGQTTAFTSKLLKPSVRVLGGIDEGTAKYVHGNFGEGTFTFMGGHDPEDFAHIVGEPPTMLSLHKDSAGYRLILNNILFPAAKKKKRKT
ncbi:MAG: asparagine synthetase B [Candidatus Wallbacteria bacterium HGW-Wallbacteria-1]|uniref:Asparagine synthetase B n=1 Tax=Candidatus Wallbacteria bacterium HGW-Wallbacteria-1 TaxID=2013854 RepID=A0A2N1PVI7_9BACT|nr:MAG: asparagine synthetase B [Candidatus Wallbacteria bacterium HGW-Wallbacteria-1]